MKYSLIIGYQLIEKNKDFPRVKVHINGQMIDEFVCDNEEAIEISATTTDSDKSHDTMSRNIHIESVRSFNYLVPKKYKVFKVDSSTWPDTGKLVVEVFDSNSDYNNGFMNKRSIVSLGTIFLIREDVLKDKSKMYRIIKKFYSAERQSHLKNIRTRWQQHMDQPRWPGLSDYPGDNQNYDNGNNGIRLASGGNFKLQCKIQKKHKTYMLIKNKAEAKGYFCMDRFFLAWYQYYSKNYFDLVGIRVRDATNNVEKLEIEIKERLKE